MADRQFHYALPPEPDTNSPEYSRYLLARIRLATGGTQETVAATRKAIDGSKVMMAETDRVLAKR